MIETVFKWFTSLISSLGQVWTFISTNETLIGIVTGTGLVALLGLLLVHFLNPAS